MFSAGLKEFRFNSAARVHPTIADFCGRTCTKLVREKAIVVDVFAGAITEEVVVTGAVNACAANTHATFTRFGGFKVVLKKTRGF